MKIDRFLHGFDALNEYPGDIATPILIPGDLDPHELSRLAQDFADNPVG